MYLAILITLLYEIKPITVIGVICRNKIETSLGYDKSINYNLSEL